MGKEGSSKPKKMSLEDEPVTIDKWDGSAVKNALDDGVKKIMTEEYGFVLDHSIVDQRLAICTIACGFSVFALVYDHFFPFPESRTVLMICSLSYFFLMGVMNLFAMYREKQIFIQALEKDIAGVGATNVWTWSSVLPKYTSEYTLWVEYTDGKTNSTREKKIEKSIGCWFDEEGTLNMEKLFADVKEMHSYITSSKKEQ